MRAKLSLAARAFAVVLAFALCFCPLSAAFAAEGAKSPTEPAAAIDPQVLAKVVPGLSKSQVKLLLGDPWRTSHFYDDDEIENEFWEYRGKDSQGTYRVHIEFNEHQTVVIVGKIPDKVPGGKGTPAKS